MASFLDMLLFAFDMPMRVADTYRFVWQGLALDDVWSSWAEQRNWHPRSGHSHSPQSSLGRQSQYCKDFRVNHVRTYWETEMTGLTDYRSMPNYANKFFSMHLAVEIEVSLWMC